MTRKLREFASRKEKESESWGAGKKGCDSKRRKAGATFSTNNDKEGGGRRDGT